MGQYRVELTRDPDLRFLLDYSGIGFFDMGESWDLSRIGSGEYTLEIRPGQGGPLLPSQDLKLEGEGGRLDLGTIDLSGKLAQTTFTLAPGVGKKDGLMILADGEGSIVKGDFSRTLKAVYPKDTRELALWVEGYRTVLVDELQREQVMDLEPGIPIAIEIDAVKDLPEDVFVTTGLKRVEEPEGGPALPGYLTQRVYFSAGLEHHVSEPGIFRVEVALGLVEDGMQTGFSSTMTSLTSEADAPIIEVKEGSELQVIHATMRRRWYWMLLTSCANSRTRAACIDGACSCHA